MDKLKIVRFYSGWNRTVEYTNGSYYAHVIGEFMSGAIEGFIIWKNDIKIDNSANYQEPVDILEVA